MVHRAGCFHAEIAQKCGIFDSMPSTVDPLVTSIGCSRTSSRRRTKKKNQIGGGRIGSAFLRKPRFPFTAYARQRAQEQERESRQSMEALLRDCKVGLNSIAVKYGITFDSVAPSDLSGSFDPFYPDSQSSKEGLFCQSGHFQIQKFARCWSRDGYGHSRKHCARSSLDGRTYHINWTR